MERYRKTLCLLLSAALTLTLGACGGGGQGDGGSGAPSGGEARSFTSVAPGNGGNVTVTVTFEGDTITDVAIDGPDETPEIGGAAIEVLGPAIVEAQSADVDSVSGATVTSEAVKKAYLGG